MWLNIETAFLPISTAFSFVFVLLSRKYKFKCKVFRIMFIFHSSKECKIAQEVKFARIAHDYQFYVNMGGVVTC